MGTRSREYLPGGGWCNRILLEVLEGPLVLAPPVVGGPQVLELLVGDLLERGLHRGRQLPLPLELLVLHARPDADAGAQAAQAGVVLARLRLFLDRLHLLPQIEERIDRVLAPQLGAAVDGFLRRLDILVAEQAGQLGNEGLVLGVPGVPDELHADVLLLRPAR